MPGNPESVVREFCKAWEEVNPEGLMKWFTEDAVYHNVPVDPATGHEAILGILKMILSQTQSCNFEMLNVASAGNVVFTERVDHFIYNGKKVDLPVAGVFEVEVDKIKAWRDYFDLGAWMKQTT